MQKLSTSVTFLCFNKIQSTKVERKTQKQVQNEKENKNIYVWLLCALFDLVEPLVSQLVV